VLGPQPGTTRQRDYTSSATPVARHRTDGCHGRQRRRRAHVRRVDRRHGAVLGGKRLRPIGQRDDDDHDHAGAGHRPVGRRGESAPDGSTPVRCSGTATIQCWGKDSSGQLGNGVPARTGRRPCGERNHDRRRVTAGWWHHSCALLSGRPCAAGARTTGASSATGPPPSSSTR
jgi:hypothetical protein